MPRNYRKKGGRKSEGGSEFMSKAAKVADIALQALEVGMFVASIVNAELKYVDTQADNVILAPGTQTLDQFDLPSAINAGDEYNERNGRSILAKHFEFQGYIKLIDTGSTPLALGYTRQARMMIIVDTGLPNNDQPSSNSVNLQLQDILQYWATPEDTIASPQDYDNQSRYHKLLDRMFTFTVGDSLVHEFKHYIPLDFHITYTGTSSVDLNQNNIYLFCFTDSDDAESDIILTYASRMSYYDN